MSLPDDYEDKINALANRIMGAAETDDSGTFDSFMLAMACADVMAANMSLIDPQAAEYMLNAMLARVQHGYNVAMSSDGETVN